MINLQAELEKYREQEALCATFLARYRYEEWEALTPAKREQETAEFLAAHKAYRIPFPWINRKCWMKRALAVIAWGEVRQESDEELSEARAAEIMEVEDRFVANITEAFVRVFPTADRKVAGKTMPAADYFADVRRRYRSENALNGYYNMIMDAIGWKKYEGDTPVIVPVRVLRLAGDMPELVMLAALLHYRRDSAANKMIIQGDFNNWYDAASGNGGEQRLTDLVKKVKEKKQADLVTAMRAGTEKNAPSRFAVAEELQWTEGEPGIAFEDDGSHLFAAQLRSFANLLRLFPKRLTAMTDEQIALLVQIAQANLRAEGAARLVGDPAADGFYLDPETAEAFVGMFGAEFGGDSLTMADLRELPEALRMKLFEEAWTEASEGSGAWLTPPYTKKLSETGKTLPLQMEQSRQAWNHALVLLVHLAQFEAHICPKEANGVYTYAQLAQISPWDAAEYGRDEASRALFDLYEETAAAMAEQQARMRFRFKKTKAADEYRYAVVTESKSGGSVKNERSEERKAAGKKTKADADRAPGGSGADSGTPWWLQS